MTSIKRKASSILEHPPSKRRAEGIPLLRYSDVPTKSTPFQQPTSLATFSYVSVPSSSDPSVRDRRFEFGNASMKRYVTPPPRAKLGYGYDRWIRRPDEKGRLDSLLRTFRHVQEKGPLAPNTIGVITWRGVMTKILTAPYASENDRDGPWTLNVMRIGETLYIEEHLDDLAIRRKNTPDPKQRQNMYIGYAFESYCAADFSGAPGNRTHPPGWNGDVDTNEQFCCVVKTKLGNTRILIGGEVDCVCDGFDGRMEKTVELKTSMRIRHEQDRMRFTQKLLKFYFQSFLLGVPKIVVGFRTPSGDLTTTETFATMDLPRMVRGKPGSWDPSLGLAWGDGFLEWLKDGCTKGQGNEHPVWRLEFTPGIGVKLWQLVDEDMLEVQRDESGNEEDRVGFLPAWYVKAMIPSPENTVASGPASDEVESMPAARWNI